MADKQAPDLDLTCQVLISLWVDGPGSSKEIAERIGLTTAQVMNAMNRLLRKSRARRAERRSGPGAGRGPSLYYVYEAVEEPLRSERPQRVKTKSAAGRQAEADSWQRKNRQRRVLESVGSDPLPDYVRWRDRKLALLRRLAEQASTTDRDLLVGIINDYLRASGAPAENVKPGGKQR
jgi:predicted ArsR family transcriptional regulator